MKILIINKFLHPKGGSETYIFRLGEELTRQGHEVQYFGMDGEGRVLGNRVGAYRSNVDFHSSRIREKLRCALQTIYSREARQKLGLVLEDFQPDVCHLNNFHYQLTPSILLEIRSWSRRTGHSCRIVYTAHDYQLVCPNHMCRNFRTGENCEKCLGGDFFHCLFGRCIHGSLSKSAIGMLEGICWKHRGICRELDSILCCSQFLKEKLDTNPVLAEKTVVLHNFVESGETRQVQKQNYVLYFGRYAEEKGIRDLIQAAKTLPQIPFVFAGSGPLEGELSGAANIQNRGFLQKAELETVIRQARFVVYPSRWYENCPFGVLESLALGTPVLAAEIGGIPELIQPGITGELFESGDVRQLREKLLHMWSDEEGLKAYRETGKQPPFLTVSQYVMCLMEFYTGEDCGT